MDPFATAALLAIAQLSMAYMAIQPTPEEVHFKGTMPCFYLTPKQDDFNKIPELQVFDHPRIFVAFSLSYKRWLLANNRLALHFFTLPCSHA